MWAEQYVVYDWIRLYAHCDTTRRNFLSAILRNADKGVGIALDELIESNNMTQLIDQPTNLESRGISCVDLIITDQPNLFIDYGIHSSLDNCCHHQIIHGKVNISIPSPPPFKRRIWDYAKANKDEIQECLNNIDWHYKIK